MAQKLATIRTKTITSTTADGLDGAVQTFVQSVREELLIEIQFIADDGFYAALIIYTV